MNDATLTWNKSLKGTPTGYSVVWNINGTAKPPVLVPATSAGDLAGYSLDAANSLGTTFNPGDVIGATVQAVDSIHSLSSAIDPSVPATVTLPTAPVAPSDPQNIVLTMS